MVLSFLVNTDHLVFNGTKVKYFQILTKWSLIILNLLWNFHPSMGEKRRNTKLLKKIALRLKDLRKKHNLTQEVVYNDTGVNVGRIEAAKRDVSISTLEIICKYFKISLSEFLGGL